MSCPFKFCPWEPTLYMDMDNPLFDEAGNSIHFCVEHFYIYHNVFVDHSHKFLCKKILHESFYYCTTLNFWIPPVFQKEAYYKVDRLLTGLTAQQIGTPARWYSNKTPLLKLLSTFYCHYYLLCRVIQEILMLGFKLLSMRTLNFNFPKACKNGKKEWMLFSSGNEISA